MKNIMADTYREGDLMYAMCNPRCDMRCHKDTKSRILNKDENPTGGDYCQISNRKEKHCVPWYQLRIQKLEAELHAAKLLTEMVETAKQKRDRFNEMRRIEQATKGIFE